GGAEHRVDISDLLWRAGLQTTAGSTGGRVGPTHPPASSGGRLARSLTIVSQGGSHLPAGLAVYLIPLLPVATDEEPVHAGAADQDVVGDAAAGVQIVVAVAAED